MELCRVIDGVVGGLGEEAEAEGIVNPEDTIFIISCWSIGTVAEPSPPEDCQTAAVLSCKSTFGEAVNGDGKDDETDGLGEQNNPDLPPGRECLFGGQLNRQGNVLRIQDHRPNNGIHGRERSSVHLYQQSNDESQMGDDQSRPNLLAAQFSGMKRAQKRDENQNTGLSPYGYAHAVTADVSVEVGFALLVETGPLGALSGEDDGCQNDSQ